jgi:hypothetical protein
MKTDQKCILDLPKDKEIVVESSTTYLWIDEDGILNAVSKDVPRTLENIRETIDIIKEMIGDKKVCFLADTSNTTYYTIEMREELYGRLNPLFKAVALVPHTHTGKLIGSILFKRKELCPIKFFDDVREAKDWLKKFA